MGGGDSSGVGGTTSTGRVEGSEVWRASIWLGWRVKGAGEVRGLVMKEAVVKEGLKGELAKAQEKMAVVGIEVGDWEGGGKAGSGERDGGGEGVRGGGEGIAVKRRW